LLVAPDTSPITCEACPPSGWRWPAGWSCRRGGCDLDRQVAIGNLADDVAGIIGLAAKLLHHRAHHDHGCGSAHQQRQAGDHEEQHPRAVIGGVGGFVGLLAARAVQVNQLEQVVE
jgi:hypothetical protein